MARAAELGDDSDDEIDPSHEQEERDEQDVSDGEETIVGPRFVEFEPVPQALADELARRQEEEEELARTFDYVPTSIDAQLMLLTNTEFGYRKQHARRMFRPPSGRG